MITEHLYCMSTYLEGVLLGAEILALGQLSDSPLPCPVKPRRFSVFCDTSTLYNRNLLRDMKKTFIIQYKLSSVSAPKGMLALSKMSGIIPYIP